MVYSSFHKYVDSVFSIAKPNLRVNGRNYEDLHSNDEGIRSSASTTLVGTILFDLQKSNLSTKLSTDTFGHFRTNVSSGTAR